VNLYST